MTAGPAEDLGPLSIVVIDIGNTNVGIARWNQEGNVEGVHRVSRAGGDLFACLDGVRKECENQQRQAIVIASVVPDETARLCEHIEEELDLRPFVVGGNTPLPLSVDVREPAKVGVDRVCSAAAAYGRLQKACAVVDIGSAVTIDVVDDEGVFRGGAILPGPALQLRALADHAAALPLVEEGLPASAVGKDTTEAIRSGVCLGIVGAIRGIVEQIATEDNAWPHLVATGGGAVLLKDHLDFVDSIVPDLCLMGVGLAYMKRIAESASAK